MYRCARRVCVGLTLTPDTQAYVQSPQCLQQNYECIMKVRHTLSLFCCLVVTVSSDQSLLIIQENQQISLLNSMSSIRCVFAVALKAAIIVKTKNINLHYWMT